MDRRSFLSAAAGVLGGAAMSSPGVNLPMFLAPGGRKGPKPPPSGSFTPPLAAGVRASSTNVGYFSEYGALTTYSDGGAAPTGWAWDGGTPNVLLSTTNGATLNLARVNGQLFIQHTNVTVTKCVINQGFITSINENPGVLTVADTTVIGTGADVVPGIRSDNVLDARRCHVTATGDGIHFVMDGSLVSQCYVGPLAFFDEEQHLDGMQGFQRATDGGTVTVEHCYIARTYSTPVGTTMNCACTMGPPTEVGALYTPTVNNNYFAGGLDHLRFNCQARNVVLTNNDFGFIDSAKGEIAYTDWPRVPSNTMATWSNNRDENGNLIPQP